MAVIVLVVHQVHFSCFDTNVKHFAVDTNLFISGIDICALNNKCNCCIETLNQWFIANRLHMNVDKQI